MRRPLQVLVLPFRKVDSEIVYLALKRSDTGYWQGAQWSRDLYVVPEFAFGAAVVDDPILSFEHADFMWGNADQIQVLMKYDSNTTAIWELHERLLTWIPGVVSSTCF